MANLSFGPAGLPLADGDHLCALYSGSQERNAILAPYLSSGLAAGLKCVCIVEVVDQPDLLAAMGDDAQTAVDTHRVELLTAADSYLNRGSFSITDTLRLWTDGIADASDSGFEGLRGAGDANGLVDHPGVLVEFAAYDSELNSIAVGQPFTVMCLWDLQSFGGDVIAELLRSHRRLILGGRVIDSPCYVSPDDYLAERKGPAWASLTDEQRRLAGHAAQGLTNVELSEVTSLSGADVDRHLHRIYRTLGIASRDALARVVTALGPRRP